ncbi:hypothetical protein ABIB57_003625 [Devosia sp. UYZn731]|uniref:hypothetical protein n=1 Tax=Devosia sp. UYZn731 TaxID=3156345 RepID=UPI003398D56E
MSDDVLMFDPITARIALYTEPTLAGDPFDPNSARNAPLNSPAANLPSLYYHSDYDPMEVAVGPTDVLITHTAIPAGSGAPDAATINSQLVYGGYTQDRSLLAHGLPYVPDFLVVVGTQTLHPGYPVQYNALDGRARCVTAYATATEIRIYETGIQTSSVLAAVNVTYTVIVLKRPPAPVGSVLFEFDPVTGITTMARGKFSSNRRYLQIVAGGSPFGFPLGRTIDLANGTFRSVQPDGTIRDVVPAAFKLSFGFGGPNFGPAGNYNGSFTGDPQIQVQAP